MTKQILFFILSILIQTNAFATMICQKTGTVSAFIKRSPNGTNARIIDSENKIWATDFEYGTVKGTAACNTLSGTSGTANTAMFTYASDHGINCWCAMQKPISSYWVYYNSYTDENTCANNCTLKCAQLMATNENNFRYSLINSIW